MAAIYVDTPAISIDADRDGEDRSSEAAEEAALVEACSRGDRAALELLYRRYSPRVFSLVCRMVGRQEAEELAQDAFVRIFRGVRGFRGSSALGTWIYRLTMNLCLSYLAKRTRRRRLHDIYERESAQSAAPAPSNPWLRAHLEQALQALPDGYRAVLVLHDVEGLSHKEIGDILACREGTSKSQLHKARLRMRELLEPALGQRGPGHADAEAREGEPLADLSAARDQGVGS